MAQRTRSISTLREQLAGGLRIPAIAAPMFLISGPDLVLAACRAGVMAAFPAPNARTLDQLDDWMTRLGAELGPGHAAWGVNLIAHRNYDRREPELALIERHRPALVITALGSPRGVIETVHGYGGAVFADVSSLQYARKAVAAGVDGLVLVCAGAGGHTGSLTPLAFVPAVREFFDGPLAVGGGITTGAALRAVRALGADYGYLGTAFIPAAESLAVDDYKDMLVTASADDLLISASVTGIPASWLKASLERAGIAPGATGRIPGSGDIDDDIKRWRDIWSAGQGVGNITRRESTAAIVERLAREYRAAADQQQSVVPQ